MSKIHFLSSDAIVEDVGDGVSREILAYGGNLMMVKVIFEKDSIGSLHNHKHEQTSYILEGEFLFTVGDQEFHCKKGDSLYIPSDAKHGTKCLVAGSLMDIFTPIREDFLR